MKAAVFDLDGTLVHSAPDIARAVNAVLADEGVAPLSLEAVTGFVGAGAPVLIARVVRATALPPALEPALLARFLALYEDAVDLTTLYPGVPEALDRLAAEGWRLGLCTNKPVGPTRSVLRHFGLTDRFATVIGGDSLPVKKPDPAPLRAAVAALGNPPTVFVGDSETDAATAAAAALPFLLFTEGYRQTPAEALPHAARFSDFTTLPGLAAAHLPG